MTSRFLAGRGVVCLGMSDVKVGCLVSLDGVHGDPRSWVGEWFDDAAAEQSRQALLGADAMLMGSGTYNYFADAWPRQSGGYADTVNGIRKYVYSSSLREVRWNNAVLVADDALEHVAALKKDGDGDLVIYGYGRLAQSLLAHDLVDRLMVWIHPVVLGNGVPMYRPGPAAGGLRLTAVDERPNGVVGLTYARDSS